MEKRMQGTQTAFCTLCVHRYVFSYSHALQNLELYTQVFFKSESSQLLQQKKPTEALDSLNC